jgi:hypothetical protein
MLVKLTFTNNLCAQIPKAQRNSQSVSLFVLLGSARVKAAYRKLVKLTLGVNFTNNLRAQNPKSAKKYNHSFSLFSAFGIYACKGCEYNAGEIGTGSYVMDVSTVDLSSQSHPV